MELTTTKAVGETIYLTLIADEEDRKDIWIDRNNNHQKDTGEDDILFDKVDGEEGEYYVANQSFRVSFKTIRIYGKVKRLDCSYNQISNLDISKNINLERLHCSDNQLTSLDVSKNVNLEYLWCDLDCVKATQEQIDAAQNGNIAVNDGYNPEILQLYCE